MRQVCSDFRPDALNAVNRLFYGSRVDIDWYSEAAGVADLYVVFQPFLKGFAAWLKKQPISKNPLRVKELCAGPKAFRKWEAIAPAYLELTDFQREPKYNLFDDFETLENKERFHLMFVSYGFDSVWLPEDVSFELKNGKWHRKVYRLKVEENLLEAFLTGKTQQRLQLKDLKGKYQIEEKALVIPDILQIPYGKEIADYYSGLRWAQPNFPGGLIRKVQQAFDRQLKRDGLFVILDSAVSSKSVWKYGQKAELSYGHTGSVALYKDEDYGLAKFILEKLGFTVRIIPVKNLTDSFLKPEDKTDSNYLEEYEALVDGQVMMVVSMLE